MDRETLRAAISAAAREWRKDALRGSNRPPRPGEIGRERGRKRLREQAKEAMGGKKSHGNTRLPYGLCKKYGIEVPPGTTPREAWDLLKGKGVSPEEEYRKLKERGEKKEREGAAGRLREWEERYGSDVLKSAPRGTDPEEFLWFRETFRRQAEERIRAGESADDVAGSLRGGLWDGLGADGKPVQGPYGSSEELAGKFLAAYRAQEAEKERERLERALRSGGTGFVPAKTLREAERYAKESLGADNALYYGLDLGVANELNRVYGGALEALPELSPAVRCLGSWTTRDKACRKDSEARKAMWAALTRIAGGKASPERLNRSADSYLRENTRSYDANAAAGFAKCGALPAKNATPEEVEAVAAALRHYDGLFINPNFGRYDTNYFNAVVQRGVETGWRPRGCGSAKAAIDQAIGSALDSLYGFSEDGEIRKLYAEYMQGDWQKLSLHARRKGVGAFVAEAWCEYMNNIPPREYAKKVGEIMTKRIAGERTDRKLGVGTPAIRADAKGGFKPIRTRKDVYEAAKRFGCDKKEVRELLKEYDRQDGMPILILRHTAAVYIEEPQNADPDEGVYGYTYSDFDR